MYTRDQYLSGEISFYEYFRQFVNHAVLNCVQSVIGLDAILSSKDEYYNDIPLKKWESMVSLIQSACGSKLREAKEGLSIASCLCVARTAAKVLKEYHERPIKNFTDEE